MILYHGSNIEVREPQLLKTQRNLDFGKGFYTTSDFEQAKSWDLDAESTIKRLLPQKLKDQYTFKTDKAIALLKCTEVKAV